MAFPLPLFVSSSLLHYFFTDATLPRALTLSEIGRRAHPFIKGESENRRPYRTSATNYGRNIEFPAVCGAPKFPPSARMLVAVASPPPPFSFDGISIALFPPDREYCLRGTDWRVRFQMDGTCRSFALTQFYMPKLSL